MNDLLLEQGVPASDPIPEDELEVSPRRQEFIASMRDAKDFDKAAWEEDEKFEDALDHFEDPKEGEEG